MYSVIHTVSTSVGRDQFTGGVRLSIVKCSGVLRYNIIAANAWAAAASICDLLRLNKLYILGLLSLGLALGFVQPSAIIYCFRLPSLATQQQPVNTTVLFV